MGDSLGYAYRGLQSRWADPCLGCHRWFDQALGLDNRSTQEPPLEGHASVVTSLAFSPDGTMLASGSWDQTIILWEVATGGKIGTLFSPDAEVQDVAFSPDGTTLASVSWDDTIYLWDVSPDVWDDLACELAGRSLSVDEWMTYLGDEPYKPTCPRVLAQADAYALAGDAEQAAAAFAKAVELGEETNSVDDNWNACWFGALDGAASIVLPACERAVVLAADPDTAIETRGLVRALTGDYRGAAEDFERFVGRAQELGIASSLIDKRIVWIAELRAGRNPFDSETLKELRTEVIKYGPPSEGTPTAAAAQSTLVPVDEGSVLAPTTMPSDVLNPTPAEPAATPALAGADTSLAKWPPIPRLAIWSQEP